MVNRIPQSKATPLSVPQDVAGTLPAAGPGPLPNAAAATLEPIDFAGNDDDFDTLDLSQVEEAAPVEPVAEPAPVRVAQATQPGIATDAGPQPDQRLDEVYRLAQRDRQDQEALDWLMKQTGGYPPPQEPGNATGQQVPIAPTEQERAQAEYGIVAGFTDPQQYSAFGKRIVPGAVGGAGTALQGVEAMRHESGQALERSMRAQLDAADRIDRGEEVGFLEDLGGYRAMSPEQRTAFRAEIERDLASVAGSNQVPIRDRPLYQYGEDIREYARTLLPAAEGYEQSVGAQLGEGLGSMLLGIPVTMLTGPVGGGVMFGTMGMGEATHRAVEFDKAERAAGRAGLTQEQIAMAGLLGVAPGTTDIVPIEILLSRTPVPQPLRRPLAQLIGRVGGQAIVEGAQEGVQQWAQNLIAMMVYNPDQALDDDVLKNMGFGGGVGGIAGAGRELLLGRRTARLNARTQTDASAQPGQPPPLTGEVISPSSTDLTTGDVTQEMARQAQIERIERVIGRDDDPLVQEIERQLPAQADFGVPDQTLARWMFDNLDRGEWSMPEPVDRSGEYRPTPRPSDEPPANLDMIRLTSEEEDLVMKALMTRSKWYEMGVQSGQARSSVFGGGVDPAALEEVRNLASGADRELRRRLGEGTANALIRDVMLQLRAGDPTARPSFDDIAQYVKQKYGFEGEVQGAIGGSVRDRVIAKYKDWRYPEETTVDGAFNARTQELTALRDQLEESLPFATDAADLQRVIQRLDAVANEVAQRTTGVQRAGQVNRLDARSGRQIPINAANLTDEEFLARGNDTLRELDESIRRITGQTREEVAYDRAVQLQRLAQEDRARRGGGLSVVEGSASDPQAAAGRPSTPSLPQPIVRAISGADETLSGHWKKLSGAEREEIARVANLLPPHAVAERIADQVMRKAVAKGETFSIDEKVVGIIKNTLAPMVPLVPRGYQMGVMTKVAPVKGGRVHATFSLPDGGTVVLDLRRDDVLNNRAFHIGGPNGFIGIVRRSSPPGLETAVGGDLVGKFDHSLRGEVAHELVHAHFARLNRGTRDRLLAHVESPDLRVLDTPITEYFKAIGREDMLGKLPEGRVPTIRDLYNRYYSTSPRKEELVREEGVAILVELAHNRAIPQAKLAPIAADLEAMFAQGLPARAPRRADAMAGGLPARQGAGREEEVVQFTLGKPDTTGTASEQALSPHRAPGYDEGMNVADDIRTTVTQTLRADDGYYYGLRVTEAPLEVGKKAPPSKQFYQDFVSENDPRYGRERFPDHDADLEGPSVVGISSEQDIDRALKAADLIPRSAHDGGSYFGDHVSLIRSKRKLDGRDRGEWVLPDGEVVAVWNKQASAPNRGSLSLRGSDPDIQAAAGGNMPPPPPDAPAAPPSLPEPSPGNFSREFQINWNRIESQDQLKAVAGQMMDAFRDELIQRGVSGGGRGYVQTWKETARQSGMIDAIDHLFKIGDQKGLTHNAAGMDALGSLYVSSMNELKRLVQAAAGPEATPETYALMRHQMTLHRMVQAEFWGGVSEAGRTLNILRKVKTSSQEYERELHNIVQSTGGQDGNKVLAKALAEYLDQGEFAKADRMIEKSATAKTLDAIVEVWKGGLLTGPFTHIVNFVSNTSILPLSMIERGIAGQIGAVLHPLDGVKIGEATAMAAGIKMAVREAVMAAGESFRSGQQVFGQGQVEAPMVPRTSAESLGVNVPSTMTQRGPSGDLARMGALGDPATYREMMSKPETMLGLGLDMLSTYATMPFRALGASDSFFKTLNRGAELMAQAVRQADNELTQGVISADRFRARVQELYENPTEEVRLAARDFAEYNTFTNEPGQITKKLESMRDWNNPVGRAIGHVIMPFTRTPGNLMTFAFADRTPIGLLTKRFWREINAGGERADLALARMGLGSIVLMVALDLALDGHLTGTGPQDPKKKEALMRSGWRPNSVRIPQGQNADGSPKYLFVPIQRLDPSATVPLLGAELAEVFTGSNRKPSQQFEQAFWASAFVVTEMAMQKPTMMGVASIMKAITNPERFADYWGQRLVGSTVPANVAYVANRKDPVIRNTEAEAFLTRMFNAIKTRLPGYSATLPPRRDFWGRELTRESGLGEVYDAASPLFARTNENAQPVDREMWRLNYFPSHPHSLSVLRSEAAQQRLDGAGGRRGPGGIAGLIAAQPDDPVRGESNMVPLRGLPQARDKLVLLTSATPADKLVRDNETALAVAGRTSAVTRLSEYGSKTLPQVLNDMVTKDPEYRRMRDDQKREMIRLTIQDFRVAASAQVIREHPELTQRRDQMRSPLQGGQAAPF